MIEIEHFEDITCVKTASPFSSQALFWVYAYHIGDTLLDSGCANSKEELREYAREHPVKRVFVTHNHEDHCGGCAAFLPEAKIFAGPQTAKALKNPIELNEFFQWVWGQPNPIDSIEPLPATFLVGDYSFEVFDFSGHCPEMAGFWEPEKKWLFSSDAVPLPSRKQIAMPDENIPKTIRRMKEIQDLDITVLFDGHRGPVVEPKHYIQTRIDHLEKLQTQVQDLHQKGKTIQEIKKILAFSEPFYIPNTEGRLQVEHLIRSLIEDTLEG